MQANKLYFRAVLAAASFGSLTLLGSAAFATPVVPGSGNVVTPGLGTFAGLSAIADETNPFVGMDVSSNVKYSGTLESTVFIDSGTGDLDFGYHVVSTGGPDSIETVSVTSYSGWLTDVDYIAGTGSETYDYLKRTTPGSGNTLSFDYTPLANSIAPGSTADWIIIKTNAQAYDNLGSTNFIDGGTASVVSYEPAFGSSIPEPASLGIFSVAGLGVLSRRARRTA